MRTEANAAGRRRRPRVADIATYVVIAGAVWFAWEVVKAPLVMRAPPATAVRVAPGSPEAIRRAAEAELLAGRTDNARFLSNAALSRAPFDARALRVRGLAEAKLGSPDSADQMLTLAGNWSLRDDPTHAWLAEHRLRRGDYGSAFAHADTLARRRADLYPSVFRLFTAAATADPRSIPHLARLLAAHPSWRPAYLDDLYKVPSHAPVVGALAVALEPTSGRFTKLELQQFYTNWAAAGYFAGIKEVRRRIGRPSPSVAVQNGDFSVAAEDQLLPFGWSLPANPGISSAIIEDDIRRNQSLRLQYDGFGSGRFAEQLLLLSPGTYVLTGQRRAETPLPDLLMDWQIVCGETGQAAPVRQTSEAATDAEWHTFQFQFTVPSGNCAAQWLRLQARPGDRRMTIAVWFDDIKIRRSTGAPAAG